MISSALVAAVAAAPEARQDAINDGVILNYALTLEHLENTFYHEALTKFSEADFRKAGVNPEFYCNLKEIASDEATHVSFLSGALSAAGVTPTAACTYDFGADTVENYLALANILEGVGVSAYLGAAQYISNKAYLTAAGSILTVEARHSAYLRDNQLIRESPFPSPFDVPLDFDEVYSLAALFIKSCPESNPTHPVKAFPVLSGPAGFAKVGDKLAITVPKSVDAKAAYFVTILGPVSAPLEGSGSSYTVTVPEGVQGGQEYLLLTSSTDKPTDDNILSVGIINIVDNVTNTTQKADGRYKGWKWNSRHF